MTLLHTNIELKNSNGAVWFFARAAEIVFSHCIKDGLFKAHIEGIQYPDRHGNNVILSNTAANTEERLYFELLAGATENSDWFTDKAYKSVQNTYEPNLQSALPECPIYQ